MQTIGKCCMQAHQKSSQIAVTYTGYAHTHRICTYAQGMHIRTWYVHMHRDAHAQEVQQAGQNNAEWWRKMCVKPTFKSMSSSAALLICISPNVLGASSRVPISRLSSLLKVAPCCTKMIRAFTPLPASSGMKGGPGVCSQSKAHTQNQYQG